MFEITLIAMGKLKEKFYLSAAAEYEKRMKGYCQFKLLELPEYRLPEDPSLAEITAGLEKEAELIFSKVPKGAWLCVLTPEGKLLSSEELAKKMKDVKLTGKSSACFVILLRHVPADKGKSRFQAVHEPHDLSPPPGPYHGTGAALPGRGHPGRKQIPQMSIERCSFVLCEVP